MKKYDLLEIIKECARQGSNRGHIDLTLDDDFEIGFDFVFYPKDEVLEDDK